MSDTIETDILIIGAGVVGLAFSETLTRIASDRTVVLVERFPKFGNEISSHNSEVIHAGIYYKGTPNKGRYCIEGRDRLYAFCREHDAPFKNCGKYIFATAEDQRPKLREIYDFARSNGVPIEDIDAARVRERVRNPSVIESLWSPTTGIVDSHGVMTKLEALACSRGLITLYQHAYLGLLDSDQGGYLVSVLDPGGHEVRVKTRRVVNCAGLSSTRVSAEYLKAAGDRQTITTQPCRGRYFSLSSRWNHSYSELLYPVPDPAGGLGVHLTFDLAGKCRLGPDVDWGKRAHPDPSDAALYHFELRDEAELDAFFAAGAKLLPGLKREDLAPDYVGVRPKLFVDGVASPDFMIRQSLPGNSGDWHLLGIESPGLTASLALAAEFGPKIAADL